MASCLFHSSTCLSKGSGWPADPRRTRLSTDPDRQARRACWHPGDFAGPQTRATVWHGRPGKPAGRRFRPAGGRRRDRRARPGPGPGPLTGPQAVLSSMTVTGPSGPGSRGASGGPAWPGPAGGHYPLIIRLQQLQVRHCGRPRRGCLANELEQRCAVTVRWRGPGSRWLSDPVAVTVARSSATEW